MKFGKAVRIYRITANENHYAIEKDGCIIADRVCDGAWKPTGGAAA
ncbi:MAG: hypothetical protein ABIQ00_20920 [Chitinophagaceae bacterium]